MITLITGTPGSGKSLYLVSQLRRELKAGRRLLVNGINGLVIDHEILDDDTCRNWQNVVQAGDILVIDEVQRIWPPVAMGSKPTPDVEALHVHRHMGIDVFVVTQAPQRMSKTVRDLVGRHVHVRRLFGLNRAVLYEWDSVHNPGGGFRDAVKTFWRYPRDVFNLYVSAEVHTKPKAVIPKALFVLPVAVIVAGVFTWMTVKHLRSGKGGAKAAETTSSASGAAADNTSSSKSGSKVWRVAGRYVIDGRAFVLVADGSGRVRSMDAKDFKGDGLALEGSVDGDRAAVWSGSLGQSVPGADKSGASPVPALGGR
ncbi:zonular occludens toxin domain-containing protein [Paraburkholderia sp. GAS82]|uniref:zonular occludens toxin domain-containing protein n=1 Tax=Paraburkholderia sp. GAS82 TaxID=3035137 RepID=UPI003D1E3FAF